jgi:hypothetical protein
LAQGLQHIRMDRRQRSRCLISNSA